MNLWIFFRSNTSFIFFSRIYTLVLGLILSIILTKQMGIDSYGEYRYFLSFFTIFSFFSLPESSRIIIKYTNLKHDDLFQVITKTKLKFSLFGSLIFLLYGLYDYQINKNLNYIYLFMAIGFPIYYSYLTFDSYLQAKLNHKSLSLHLILRLTIQSIAIIVIYFITENIYWTIVFYIITFSIYNLIAYSKITKKARKETPKYKYSFFSRKTIILSAFGIFGIIGDNIDKLIIGKYFSYAELSYYTIGLLISTTIFSFIKLYINSYNAKFVKISINKLTYLFVFIGGTLFGLFLSFLSEPIILFFYGNEFSKSIFYSNLILSFSGVYAVSILYYNSYFYYYKNKIENIYFHDLSLPIMKILFLILILMSNYDINDKMILLILNFPLSYLLSISVIYFLKNRTYKK